MIFQCNSFLFKSSEIRQITTILYEECSKKFKDSIRIAIGGLIFLRFVCPAITTPKGIVVDDDIQPNARRTLLLITKILQNLSNGVRFQNKEQFMIPANDTLDKYHEPIGKMLSQIPIHEDEFKVKKSKDTGSMDFQKAIMITNLDVADLWSLYVVHIYFYNNLSIIKEETDLGMFSLPVPDPKEFEFALSEISKEVENLGRPCSTDPDESKVLKPIKKK
jgi:hypothetical protein